MPMKKAKETGSVSKPHTGQKDMIYLRDTDARERQRSTRQEMARLR
jgi:hypothetical protein